MSHQPASFKRGDDGRMQVDKVSTDNGSNKILFTDGVFVFVGVVTNLPPGIEKITRDESGAVLTNDDIETNIPGIFVAGDVRSKRYSQITTAVSDSTMAAMAVTRRHYG